MYTLVILFLFPGGFSLDPNSVAVVPGFNSLELCEVAKKQINLTPDPPFEWCVRTK